MIVGRALQGIGHGRRSRSASASCATCCPRERLGSAIALMSASLGVGGALGLPIAALVAQHADWHVLFWALGRRSASSRSS